MKSFIKIFPILACRQLQYPFEQLKVCHSGMILVATKSSHLCGNLQLYSSGFPIKAFGNDSILYILPVYHYMIF